MANIANLHEQNQTLLTHVKNLAGSRELNQMANLVHEQGRRGEKPLGEIIVDFQPFADEIAFAILSSFTIYDFFASKSRSF